MELLLENEGILRVVYQGIFKKPTTESENRPAN